MSRHTPPEIIEKKSVAKSNLFEIEQLHLNFSNGEQRIYERMKPVGHNSVMIVPVTQNNELLLVREYCAGTECYELGFPKGLIDFGESAQEAANRELKEEIGFGANIFVPLKEVVLAPSYFSSKMTLFLAKDLFPEQLEGDEPEPLQLVRWPLSQANELLTHLDFRESRSIVALMLTIDLLKNEKNEQVG